MRCQPETSASDFNSEFRRAFAQNPSLAFFEVARFETVVDQRTKNTVIITTRRVSFEVARFRIAVDQAGKKTGDYHNPTRQRGIFPNTA